MAENDIQNIAMDIMKLSQNQLMTELRYIGAAIGELRLDPEGEAFSTDGVKISFQPDEVIRLFREDNGTVPRSVLHMVLHCLFRHGFSVQSKNPELWDLACDISVENIINGMRPKCVTDSPSAEQKEALALLKDVGSLTAEKLYARFMKDDWKEEYTQRLRGIFYADSHSDWYMGGGGQAAEELAEYRNGLAERWKDISNLVMMESENFMAGGNIPDDMKRNITEVNRERYDYSKFLEKFAVRAEKMQVSDEEFDYVTYSSGMALYDGLALVEPLEYRDARSIKDFVIAIDTSGSTYNDLVDRFLTKTFNILMQRDSFFSRVNIHIIQCDAAIQQDVVIHSEADLRNYVRNMSVHGGGGTDFRPVFSYVDALRNSGELRDIKGLIYFTDGLGTYPSGKPDYETAFVFVGSGSGLIEPVVPAWAIKIELPDNFDE